MSAHLLGAEKIEMRSSCQARVAMGGQRACERHATVQMGRNCGFRVQKTGLKRGAVSR
jgi:hypothetical protein